MKKKLIAKVSGILAGLTLAVTSLVGCGVAYGGDTTDCLVTDKYVKIADKQSLNMVASSCGVFMVQDELSQGNWNAADVYAGIQIGKTYDFESYGYRNGFLSAYPNINSATEVESTSE